MSIHKLLELNQKKFEKKFKESDAKAILAKDVKPLDGIVLDNPLLEFLVDRRILPFGRCVLIYGPKGASKTSLLLDLFKLVQNPPGSQSKGEAIWIETEQAKDLDYAKKQGVDINRLVIEDQCADIKEWFAKALGYVIEMPNAFPEGNTPIIMGFDGMAGICNSYELDDAMVIGDQKPGDHAKHAAEFYRKLVRYLSREKMIFVMTNQLRDKIGGMTFGQEKGEELIGGQAQRFNSTFQWKMARIADITATDVNGAKRKVGSTHTITGKRNKVGREGGTQKIEIDIFINGGIDWWTPLVRKLGEEYGNTLHKSGSSYTWLVDNCAHEEFVNSKGEVVPAGVISTEDGFKDHVLGLYIKHSNDAKEAIRKLWWDQTDGTWESRLLPSKEVVAELDSERKKKRKKKVLDEDDDMTKGLD